MLSLSRRTLLGGVSSFLVARVGTSDLLAHPETAVSSGRINLGLNGVNYHSLFFPFINVWKCANHIQIAAGSTSRWSNVPFGQADSPWGVYIDNDGELINPLPSDFTAMRRIFVSRASDGNPAGYDRTGEQWVLKWDGMATDVKISGAPIRQRRIGRRVEWIYPNSLSNLQVEFAGVDKNNPPRNIRLFEARFESRLDSGEIFNPDWLANVRSGSGIVRFMDWQATNSNRSTLRYSDIPTPSFFKWGLDTKTSGLTGGMPVSIMWSLANAVQSHPWVCIPHVLGTAKMAKITGITKSNPAIVSATNHGFSNDDQVIVYGIFSGMTQPNKSTYKVANATRSTFELSGTDSSSWSTYTSGGYLTSPYDLGRITAEVASLAAHFRDNVNPSLVTYFEFSNETWNFIFDQPHWLAAQARGFFSGDDEVKMAGYLAAHCMKVIRDTYGLVNRARWKGMLPTQTTVTGVTHRYIEGVKRYITDHAPTLTITDLFNDLAVAGYFGGHFANAYAAITRRWMNTSTERWTDGLEPTKYSYFNRVVNEDVADGRHTGMRYSVDKIVAFWKAQKAVADANGLGLIQYEGGNHNNLQGTGMATDAQYLEFYPKCNHTPEDAANYTAMFNNFIALGGQYPSKFVEGGPVTRFGAWGGFRYLGDNNPVWDAVVDFNKRS